MAAGKIQHWKHGWIPLSPAAKAFAAGRGPNPTGDQGKQVAAKKDLLGRMRARIVTKGVLNRAEASEPAITSALQDSAGRVGGRLVGLQHKVKTSGSLERKIKDKAAIKGVTQEAYAAKIGDAVRYTMEADEADYADMVQRTLRDLEDQGYTRVSFDNTWGIPDAEYRGINTNILSPDGVLFELQFHTPDSFKTKMANHADFEIVRQPDKYSAEERAAASLRMKQSVGALSFPAGVTDLPASGVDW